MPAPVVGQAWFGDPLFRLGFGLWILTIIVVLVPILPAETRWVLSDRWTDFVTLPYTLFLALVNVRRSTSPSEHRFWSFFAAGLSMWLVVRVMYVAWPDATWGAMQDLTIDVL